MMKCKTVFLKNVCELRNDGFLLLINKTGSNTLQPNLRWGFVNILYIDIKITRVAQLNAD